MEDLSEQCRHVFEEGDKEDALRLLSKMQQPDQSLVHFAVWHGWLDVCQQLVEKYSLSPSDEAEVHGCVFRPLHWACTWGRTQVVKYLLSFPSVLLTVNELDSDGMSALGYACHRDRLSVIEVLLSEPSVKMPSKLHSHNFAVLSLLSRRMNWSDEFPVLPYFRVFMVGNTGAGKTTLTTAMLQLTDLSFSRHGKQVSGVKTLTAGICPSQCSG